MKCLWCTGNTVCRQAPDNGVQKTPKSIEQKNIGRSLVKTVGNTCIHNRLHSVICTNLLSLHYIRSKTCATHLLVITCSLPLSTHSPHRKTFLSSFHYPTPPKQFWHQKDIKSDKLTHNLASQFQGHSPESIPIQKYHINVLQNVLCAHA